MKNRGAPVLLLVCAAVLPVWGPTLLPCDRLPAPHLMEQTPATTTFSHQSYKTKKIVFRSNTGFQSTCTFLKSMT